MSRKINLEGELSDADRAYLESRGREGILAHHDYMARVEAAEAARMSQDHRSFVNKTSSDVLQPGEHPNGDGDEVETEEVDLPYHKWKKAELQEEARLRNLPDEGNVKELAERLEANDAEDENAE